MMKKIIYLMALLIMGLQCHLFSINEPVIRCLEVTTGSLGRPMIKITWDHPSDQVGLPGCKYTLYFSESSGGPFQEIFTYQFGRDTLPDVNSTEHYYANAFSQNCYYYLNVLGSNGVSVNSSIVCSFNFTLSSNINRTNAILSWADPFPLNGFYANVYEIWRKTRYDRDFTAYATASREQALHFTDIIDVCNDSIAYKIKLQYDNPGTTVRCQVVSRYNIDLFTDGTIPPPPTFDSVSVDDATGFIMLGWTPPDEPIMAYQIVVDDGTSNFVPVDTVFNATFWIDDKGVRNPSDGVFVYDILAFDSCWNRSPHTEQFQNNMQLTYRIDACEGAQFFWNAYRNMASGVDHYEIYFAREGGALTFLARVAGDKTSYSFPSIEKNVNYCFMVRAFNVAGQVTSSSSKACFIITAEEQNDFAYVSHVSVVDNSFLDIEVYTSGVEYPFKTIELYKSTDNGLTFSLLTASSYHSSPTYSFTDASVNVNSSLYYYKAVIINACDHAVAESNVGHNIVLNGESNSAHQDRLSWNSYGEWNGGVEGYSVYRLLETESDFARIAEGVEPADYNHYIDDVSSLFAYGSNFRYYVEAVEAENEYGIVGKSRSNEVSMTQYPSTYIPNSFTPLSNINKVFIPVNSFVSPLDYYLEIYSRSGQLVFVTRDPYQGWDGYENGKLAPTGVYVFRLSYTYPDGTKYKRHGTVTLLK